MGVLLGLAAAVCWGSGDLFITFLARSVGTIRALVGIQAFSLLSWLTLIGFMWSSPSAPTRIWLLALLCGVLHVIGLFLTYRAFEIGTLSIVSPFASSFAIVTAILALASGERPAGWTLAGAALLILGVIVVTGSTPDSGERSLRGVPEAIGSAVAFGVMFWLADMVNPVLGLIWPLIVLKVMALSYSLMVLALMKPKEELTAAGYSRGKIWLLAVIAALTDTLAWLTWLYGTTHADISVVTALASLFGAVTVLLAWIFLRERLAPRQWIGVAIVLLGVLVVSIDWAPQ